MTGNSWLLKRTRQCARCPWRVDVDPYDIPNGYDLEKHKALKSTIVSGLESIGHNTAMACHETGDAHCVGWLHNQIGSGNNIGLRMAIMTCDNIGELTIVGEQHPMFKNTLP